jgi:hypothetical protein
LYTRAMGWFSRPSHADAATLGTAASVDLTPS